jgi:hypothetical protein
MYLYQNRNNTSFNRNLLRNALKLKELFGAENAKVIATNNILLSFRNCNKYL